MIRIFRVFIPTTVVLLALSEMILLFGCLCAGYAIAVARSNLEAPLEIFLLQENGILRISLAVATMMISLYFQDLYTDFRLTNRLVFLQQLIMVVGLTFLGQALLTYAHHDLMLSRFTMIYGCIVVLIVLPVWRMIYTSAAMKLLGHQTVLMIGGAAILEQIARRIAERPEQGSLVCGYLEELIEGQSPLEGIPMLGTIADLERLVAVHRPDRIIVGMRERRQRLPVFKLLDLRMSGIHIEDAAHAYESLFGRISTRELRPSQLVFSTELGPSSSSVSLQNIYSLAFALIGTVLCLPLMAVVALLVKLTSKGPVLHSQTRVGLQGRIFTVYKFRSMFNNAEASTGAVWAVKDDPRITWIGKYLRRFRLDELPQFVNVLRGDMSMIGPRPERPEFTKTLCEQIPFYRQRLCVKPGLTGWAQINHKYGDTIEDTNTKLEYDLYYIKHISFALDMYILVNTAKTVLLGLGAQ
jgi:exopolysaccharide biosynthesis polyprenyl glycosylphosphotransferase